MSTIPFSPHTSDIDSTSSVESMDYSGLAQSPEFMDAMNGVSLILQIALFLFFAFFQYMLSKKLEVKYSWMAWIPFLNYFNQLWIAGKTVSWWLKWVGTLILTLILAGVSSVVLSQLSGAFISGIITVVLFLIFFLCMIYVNVSISHGISKRTGHGGWWTVGLIFAGWLLFPVTALHYEKGDEVTPRPFTGLRKGLLIFFSLGFPVIILIVFWIFATTLLPTVREYPQENESIQMMSPIVDESVSSVDTLINPSSTDEYSKRTRDTERISHLKSITTALSSYFIDNEKYPDEIVSGCVPLVDLEGYLRSGEYRDPVPTNLMPGCDGSDGTYAYRSITGEDGVSGFVIGARLEDERGGNSNLPIDEIDSTTLLMKGSGPYYYIVR